MRDEGPMRAGQRAYSTSKLCNVLGTYALHERLSSGDSYDRAKQAELFVESAALVSLAPAEAAVSVV